MVFRKRDPQSQLFETTWVLPAEKQARLGKTWAHEFRERALPLIKEEPFAPMFDASNGCPNRPAQVVLGVLILKEMFDLTDDGALEQLEFNLQWQHALRLTPSEAHLAQKTLHNFRVRLIKHDGGRLAFQTITSGVVEALGTRVERQRLDSTHILSNFAVLTRLGLFCETLRVALVALRRQHPKLFGKLPAGLRKRYLRDDETKTGYRDAKSDEARRRLDVCARDVYRVLAVCEGKYAANLEAIEVLQRLFDEQCDLTPKAKERVTSEDDAEDGDAPVVTKDPGTISSASLQTPHDPDATYSGHKGKGYEVQIAETCHEANDVEVITHVAVTPSCEGDAKATIPVIEDLAKRDLKPAELVADTLYGSAENAVEAAKLGTELVSPVGGSTQAESSGEAFKDAPFTPADFAVDPTLKRVATCPAGREAASQQFVPKQANTVELKFDAAACASCPLAPRCPAKATRDGDHVVRVNLPKANLEQRRRAEARGELHPRYRIRAGIEATNSELKRSHGLDKLRVRGEDRVTLVVYLKAAACNVKRMLRALLSRGRLASATA